ncbi:MAG: hypothetical protein R3F62_15155 [Planctomycetota bacterium]
MPQDPARSHAPGPPLLGQRHPEGHEHGLGHRGLAQVPARVGLGEQLPQRAGERRVEHARAGVDGLREGRAPAPPPPGPRALGALPREQPGQGRRRRSRPRRPGPARGEGVQGLVGAGPEEHRRAQRAVLPRPQEAALRGAARELPRRRAQPLEGRPLRQRAAQ